MQTLDLFGRNTDDISSALFLFLLLFALGLTAWAVLSGRPVDLGSIEFGPFKLGPFKLGSITFGRKSAKSTAVTPKAKARPEEPNPLMELKPANTRVYKPHEAVQFYNAIAVNYDQRNSPSLLATHMEVISQVDRVRKVIPDLNILDLGAGTGQNVATHFFNDTRIRWTYVDFSHAMVDQLQKHLAGRPLYERLSVHIDDINHVHRRLPARSYDVVLLNLVLSSMPQLPDFNRIARLLAPGGLLIISDINPLYTNAHPYYIATAADGTPAALQTQAVHPLEVVTHANDAGLHLSGMSKIGSSSVSYSFIALFAAAVRRDQDHGCSDSEALPK
jgi:SAM-dependent methyltransferase